MTKLEDLIERKGSIALGGGQARIEKQHEQGKMTARERLETLFDPNTFVEIDAFVVHRCYYFGQEKQHFPGDGVVGGYGKVDGRIVYAYAQDFTVVGGSMGEVSAIALLIGGIYLLVRKVITIQIPAAYILTVAVLAVIFPAEGYGHLEYMLYSIFGGGLMLGAIFMATDYVTSPMTHKGMLIYGVGIGLLTVIIRVFGAYPEGMSFAILIMNGFTPLINRYCKPRRF